MFNAALLNDGMQILSMRGNGSSRVQVIAHQPHHNADIAILYVPGYRASHKTDPKAEAVRQAAERLCADAFFFDYHGHAPDEPQTNLCLETYRDNAAYALEHVMDEFKHQRVVLVAHSMAAVFATKLAAHHHRNVAGMVLVAPVIGLMDPPVIDEDGQIVIHGGLGHKRILQVPEIAARYEAGEHVSPRGINVLQYDPKFLKDYAAWGSRERIPEGIRCPVAIIAAERDPFVHPTHVDVIQGKVPGCEQISFIPGTTHEMKEEPAIAALTETLMMFMPKIRARGLHL
jgi:pimeloyl-ACP methyl ester carboxylesterase